MALETVLFLSSSYWQCSHPCSRLGRGPFPDVEMWRGRFTCASGPRGVMAFLPSLDLGELHPFCCYQTGCAFRPFREAWSGPSQTGLDWPFGGCSYAMHALPPITELWCYPNDSFSLLEGERGRWLYDRYRSILIMAETYLLRKACVSCNRSGQCLSLHHYDRPPGPTRSTPQPLSLPPHLPFAPLSPHPLQHRNQHVLLHQ